MSKLAGPVAVACDHGGFMYKSLVIEFLADRGFEILDLGTNSPDSVDYPEFGRLAAEAVTSGRAGFGVVICGSGIGISIAANRVSGARAALCQSDLMARLSREHNNANILALGARLIGPAVVESCLEAFIETEFSGGRHERRVALIDSAG